MVPRFHPNSCSARRLSSFSQCMYCPCHKQATRTAFEHFFRLYQSLFHFFDQFHSSASQSSLGYSLSSLGQYGTIASHETGSVWRFFVERLQSEHASLPETLPHHTPPVT